MRTRSWGRVGAAVALLSLSQILATPTASAAETAGCFRSACTGKNPVTMGCDADAQVLEQINQGNDIELKLVFSPACGATWTKVSVNPLYKYPVWAALWQMPTLGGFESPRPTPSITSTNASDVSPMGDWKNTSKACWNGLKDAWDPEPLLYEEGGRVVVTPLVNGNCTEWI
ncbi:DUF2690 domain-containing protein [Streptomyces sp. NRRL B-24572]|uniref:DUF2690 domain-containing protein n=1 Tax=Streptomyces sp. NRRL B-24572 TaxID=1962156 RepID=UPI0015C4FABF|nr:DUF2690 domain-containing protein [Streptomyces sp. NRRL B-24572]